MTPKGKSVLSRYFTTIVVLVILGLLVSGYAVYARFINVPPAQVYIAQRGTAIAAVYGTVSIQSVLTLPVNAQNSGYIHIDPALGTTVTSQGIHVKKDQLMATIIGRTHDPRSGLRAHGCRSRLRSPQAGCSLAGDSPIGQGSVGRLSEIAHGCRWSAQRSCARGLSKAPRTRLSVFQAAVNNEKLEAQRQLDNAASAVKTIEDQLKHTEVRSPLGWHADRADVQR